MRKNLLFMAAQVFMAGLMLIAWSNDLSAQSPNKTKNDNRGSRNGANKNEPEKIGNRRSDGQPGQQRRFDPAAIFKRLDRNRDGALTKAEIPERMQRRMESMDIDHDGTIKLDELKSAWRQRLQQPGKASDGLSGSGKGKPKGKTQNSSASMIERVDRDSDGQISLEEAPERMKQKFFRMDTNGNGLVDEQELQSVLQKLKDGKQGSRYDSDPDASKGQIPKRPDSDN